MGQGETGMGEINVIGIHHPHLLSEREWRGDTPWAQPAVSQFRLQNSARGYFSCLSFPICK